MCIGGHFLKAHTHTPTFAESADSSSESADSNADSPLGMSLSADCPYQT